MKLKITMKDILKIYLILLGCCECSKSHSHPNQKVRVPACIFKGIPKTIESCGKDPKLHCSKGDTITVTQVFYESGPRNCDSPDVCDECCINSLPASLWHLNNVKQDCDNHTNCSIETLDNKKYNINYHCVAANPPQARPSSTTTLAVTVPTITSPPTTSSTPPLETITTITTTTTSNVVSVPPTTSTITETHTPTPYQTTKLSPKTSSKSSKLTTRTSPSTIENNHGSANEQRQTDSEDLSIVAVAAPVAIVIILAIVILVVICIVRRRRHKNDGIYSNDDQNNSNNMESISNPAYTTNCLDNIIKPSNSVERTSSSFSKDSGYAECKDVDTMDANNGEYNTINFTQRTSNIDPAYSHIPKQDNIVDNTYSHITSDQNNPTATSNYSHMNIKTRQPNKNVNHSTYNTLQTHAVNKPQHRLPVNDKESENEYNHANFSSVSSKQDDKDTDYSHLNSSKNGITRTSPSQANSSPNDVEYAEVANNNDIHDLNDDNDHAYFVLEKDDVRGAVNEPCDGRDNNAHTYFVLEKDKANTTSKIESEVESTSHDYFVLTKQ